MTNILVISDSHGLTESVRKIANRHHNANIKIHCGDSELASNAPQLEEFKTVKGNCDWDQSFPEEEVVDVNDFRIFVTHGHLYGVKSSLLQLQYRAEELQADIVLFGHSHVAYCEKQANMLFINPGSIRQPRKWNVRSYVMMTLHANKEISVTFHNIEGNKVGALPFEQSFQL